MSDSVDLDAVLRRAQSGDAEAYGAAVEATQARLRSFIAGYVPRAEWVDDIAQQAYVSAYQSLSDFAPGTDFYAWLRQIAFNHLRAELEKASRRRRLEKDRRAGLGSSELLRRLDDDDGDDEEILLALRACVGELPPASREMIDGYYGRGVGLSELGRTLGRTADSLKVSLFKIRARLRECVERRRAALEAGRS
ncbi:MAG TPA: sigma-70 family RNA polymerase sigma factor [Planctomycetota bacterium]|nr:sigma-70 family RNA polymerase sigma factor [Planctomycetota bacterium]